MKIKKNDIILIAILLIITIALFFGYRFINSLGGAGGHILISVGGTEYSNLSLSEEGIYLIRENQSIRKLDSVSVPSDITDKRYNIIEIKNKKVSMLLAGCPDLLCVHQKSIETNGEEIVCLPNKVIIEVVNGSSSHIDDVAS